MICEERRVIGLNRPRAPNRRHWRRGPSSARISLTNKSLRVSPRFSSAFARAEAIALDTGTAALVRVLSNPSGLRAVVLLNEILSPPLALRADHLQR